MNSVERIKEYDQLAQEAPDVVEECRPPENWPDKGEITFKDYSLSYREVKNKIPKIKKINKN